MGHKICHMFADSFFFKQKIYWSFFVVVINVWPLNYFKLQPMQPLQAVVSSSTSSHQPNILWLHRTTLQPLPSTRFSPHSNDNQIKVPCYFQMVFYLLSFMSKNIWPIKYSFVAGSQQTPLNKELQQM